MLKTCLKWGISEERNKDEQYNTKGYREESRRIGSDGISGPE